MKERLKHAINAMEVYKQSVEQLVINTIQQSVIPMEKEKQWILCGKDKNR
jgi:hypothetical protein